MQSIKLIGIGNSRYLQVKSNLEAALRRLNIDLPVEEVTEVDAILKYGLDTIPAVLVNEEVVFDDGAVPSIEAFMYLIKNIPPKAVASKMILVPIDFSETSRSAFLYAQQLAEETKSEIKVVHIASPVSINPTPHNPAIFLEENVNYTVDRVNEFIQTNSLVKVNGVVSSAIKVNIEVIVGYVEEELVRFSKREDVDMIVMGTTGENTLLRKMFGSVSIHVCRNAWTPVLLIPNSVAYKAMDNIAFATDNRAVDKNVLRALQPWIKQFDAFIHTVHVKEDQSNTYDEGEVRIQKLKEVPDFAYKSVTIESDTIEYGLNRYIEQNNIDMLVMVTSHRGFIENLLHRSTTKRMIFNTEVPLMVMHYED